MSCNHCVKAVTDAVSALAGVEKVAISLEQKSVEVEHAESVSLDQLKEAIEDQGYDVLA